MKAVCASACFSQCNDGSSCSRLQTSIFSRPAHPRASFQTRQHYTDAACLHYWHMVRLKLCSQLPTTLDSCATSCRLQLRSTPYGPHHILAILSQLLDVIDNMDALYTTMSKAHENLDGAIALFQVSSAGSSSTVHTVVRSVAQTLMSTALVLTMKIVHYLYTTSALLRDLRSENALTWLTSYFSLTLPAGHPVPRRMDLLG